MTETKPSELHVPAGTVVHQVETLGVWTGVNHYIGERCPLSPEYAPFCHQEQPTTPKQFGGYVRAAGGGEVAIVIDRDIKEYPEVGVKVIVAVIE